MYAFEKLDAHDINRFNRGFASLDVLRSSERPKVELVEFSKMFGVSQETVKRILQGKTKVIPSALLGYSRDELPARSVAIYRLLAGLLSVEPMTRPDSFQPDGMPRTYKAFSPTYETVVTFAEALEKHPETTTFPKHVQENWIEYSAEKTLDGYIVRIVWLFYPDENKSISGILEKDREANKKRIEKGRKKTGFKAGEYKQLASHLNESGYFAGGYAIPEDGIIVASKAVEVPSYPQMATEISGYTGGTWHVNGERLVWAYGQTSVAIHTPETYAELIRARTTAKAVLGRNSDKRSVSALAREILSWINPEPASPNRNLIQRNILGGKQYVYCQPGTIEDAKHIDITSAYYNTLARFPSEKPLDEEDGKILWKAEDSATERFKHAIKHIGTDKTLRNVLVGSMARGVEGSITVFKEGKSFKQKTASSPWADTGTLVWRAMSEVMAKTRRETDAKLSIVDCLICQRQAVPNTWANIGLPWKTVSAGEAEIHSLTSFRVGDRATIPYQRGYTENFETEEEETGNSSVLNSVFGVAFAV